MINISAAMGGQFAWSAAEFTEEIKQLGQNPLKVSKLEGQENTKEEVTE